MKQDFLRAYCIAKQISEESPRCSRGPIRLSVRDAEAKSPRYRQCASMSCP